MATVVCHKDRAVRVHCNTIRTRALGPTVDELALQGPRRDLVGFTHNKNADDGVVCNRPRGTELAITNCADVTTIRKGQNLDTLTIVLTHSKTIDFWDVTDPTRIRNSIPLGLPLLNTSSVKQMDLVGIVGRHQNRSIWQRCTVQRRRTRDCADLGAVL